MQPFQYFILRFFLKAVYIVPLVPVVMLLQYCEAHEALTRFVWIIALLGCLYLALAFYLAHKTAQHMAFDAQPLPMAVRSAFFDVRLYLVFLPVIGNWFAGGRRNKHGDDEDDDPA